MQEFRRQIQEKGYKDLEVLVAFSGEVNDDGTSYTEEGMNKTKTGEIIKEKSLQTLSRVDRTTRGKLDAFVLDFVNSAEDIKASFEPFYEETVLLEETDPNVVYDMKNTLDGFRVYQTSEVDKFADLFYQKEEQTAGYLTRRFINSVFTESSYIQCCQRVAEQARLIQMIKFYLWKQLVPYSMRD